MFGTILISIVTLMHVYVFGRAVSVPFIKSRISKKYIIGAGLILWIWFIPPTPGFETERISHSYRYWAFCNCAHSGAETASS